MKRKEKAAWYFRNGFNCSQAVFAALSDGSEISEDESLKIACAFGGGMGRQQFTCGAVTGGLMALGLKFGKPLHGNESDKQKTYALTLEFCNEFARQHGALNCRELLLGLDMNNPEDNRRIKEQGLSETHCVRFVENAVGIVEKIIQENEK